VQSCPPYVQNLLILAQLYGALPRGTWVRKFMSGVTRGIEAAETKGAGTAPKLPLGAGTEAPEHPNLCWREGTRGTEDPRVGDEGPSRLSSNYCAYRSRSRSAHGPGS